MTRLAFAVLLLVSMVAAACAPRPRYYERGQYDRGYERAERPYDDRDAWEIVRSDPCRYDEYRRFAEKHKNPDKRRQVVWQLARDGCTRARDYEYDRRGYTY